LYLECESSTCELLGPVVTSPGSRATFGNVRLYSAHFVSTQARVGFQPTGYNNHPCFIIISRICKHFIPHHIPNTMLSDILFNKYICFDLNNLNVNFIIDFLFSLKDVNTLYYTASVPKASQNMTLFLRIVLESCVGRQHVIINISILQYTYQFNFKIRNKLIPHNSAFKSA